MHIDFHLKVFRDPWFITGFFLALLFAIATILGPLLAPFDPWDMSFVPISPPSDSHILGINDGGQDIFSELFYAIRNTA
jgi:peptide/nickel transport system permease protein